MTSPIDRAAEALFVRVATRLGASDEDHARRAWAAEGVDDNRSDYLGDVRAVFESIDAADLARDMYQAHIIRVFGHADTHPWDSVLQDVRDAWLYTAEAVKAHLLGGDQ